MEPAKRIAINTIKILTLPAFWLCLYLGYSIAHAMLVYLGVEMISSIMRPPFLKLTAGLSVRHFVVHVFGRVMIHISIPNLRKTQNCHQMFGCSQNNVYLCTYISTMKRIKIFISSVQSEFAKERQMLRNYINTDTLLGSFFDVFIFEDMPAYEETVQKVYLKEVGDCDIYIGLFGNKYGYEDSEGISPTDAMYLNGYIEKVGTGTEDLVRRCINLGLKEPSFQQGDIFKLTIWRAEKKDGVRTLSNNDSINDSNKVTDNVSNNVSNDADNVSDAIKELPPSMVINILSFIDYNPNSRKNILLNAGLSNQSYNINRFIKPLTGKAEKALSQLQKKA